jgi:hypothetical protein
MYTRVRSCTRSLLIQRDEKQADALSNRVARTQDCGRIPKFHLVSQVSRSSCQLASHISHAAELSKLQLQTIDYGLHSTPMRHWKPSCEESADNLIFQVSTRLMYHVTSITSHYWKRGFGLFLACVLAAKAMDQLSCLPALINVVTNCQLRSNSKNSKNYLA